MSPQVMRSLIVKRSLVVAGHKTSVSLEEAFWTSLREIAEQRRMTLSDLTGAIDAGREGNLSSAIRLFVLDYHRHRHAERAAQTGTDRTEQAEVAAYRAG